MGRTVVVAALAAALAVGCGSGGEEGASGVPRRARLVAGVLA